MAASMYKDFTVCKAQTKIRAVGLPLICSDLAEWGWEVPFRFQSLTQSRVKLEGPTPSSKAQTVPLGWAAATGTWHKGEGIQGLTSQSLEL